MVVVCHAGVVEEGGIHRVACIVYYDVFGGIIVSGFAGREFVEFIDDKRLVVCPCYFVAFFTHEARDAIRAEGFVVGEEGDAVDLSSLLSDDISFDGSVGLRGGVSVGGSVAIGSVDYAHMMGRSKNCLTITR